MAGAVYPELPPTMLVPGASRELWSPGVPSAMLVHVAWRELWARCSRRLCWFPGHGGSYGPEAADSHVGYLGMA